MTDHRLTILTKESLTVLEAVVGHHIPATLANGGEVVLRLSDTDLEAIVSRLMTSGLNHLAASIVVKFRHRGPVVDVD